MVKDTLCWNCAKACGLCSWSDHWQHRPVKGWEAVKTRVRLDNDHDGSSYIVLSCPEFEDDRPKKARKKEPEWVEAAMKRVNCQKQG